MHIKNFNEYLDLFHFAQKNPQAFWQNMAQHFVWKKAPSKIQSGSFLEQNIKWFEDGKLNICENAIDRHLPLLKDKKAVIYIPNSPTEKIQEFTYQELFAAVNQAANALKSIGVKKGDIVTIYMGMVPEILISVLACARLGATHSVVFGGFSAQSLAGRMTDSQSQFLIASDIGQRGDKIIPLKKIVDEALKECPFVQKVLVHQRALERCPLGPNQIWWQDLVPTADKNCPAEEVDSEHPLFILYTSGSTGKPKGLLHTTAGYMCYAAYTFQNVFQMGPRDIFWCTADLGWITGHSYVTYGPLLSGSTTVLFEGVPTSPTPARFWEEIERVGITHFYTAPTAIRALEAQGNEWVENKKLTTLKVLGSVGEPINEEAWQWYHNQVGKGRCPIVDTWWQTETGGIMISPLAGITPLIPACATFPLPGIEAVLMDQEGKEIPWKKGLEIEGNLCIKNPWPGMARTILNDKQRFFENYFKPYAGYYFTGDGAKRDALGNFRITGRVDDVVNVSGHRIGTAEVEDIINKHPLIVESAVVGAPHPIKGQALYAYCIMTKDKDSTSGPQLLDEINQLLLKEIGAISKVDWVQLVSDLPKTRSGKIMRRILRKIAEGDTSNLGDTSTLLNPQIVEGLMAGKMN